jgi:hypothetical protein
MTMASPVVLLPRKLEMGVLGGLIIGLAIATFLIRRREPGASEEEEVAEPEHQHRS